MVHSRPREVYIQLKSHKRTLSSEHSCLIINRPVARIDLGGVRDPKMWTFWTQKVDFFQPHPLTLLQKPHFWPTLWLKVDLLADLGGALHPRTPLATGLIIKDNMLVFRWITLPIKVHGYGKPFKLGLVFNLVALLCTFSKHLMSFCR